MVLIVCLFVYCVDAAFRFLFIKINIYKFTSKPDVDKPELLNLTLFNKIATKLLQLFSEMYQEIPDVIYFSP